jgi:hypothetical protein
MNSLGYNLSVMEQTELICEIGMDSMVVPKYYMQFGDYELIDLVRMAVKDIVTFGITLSDLPIAELQRESFLIYHRRTLTVKEVESIIHTEIRKAIRFHKKQLINIYSMVEGSRHSLCDMRGD